MSFVRAPNPIWLFVDNNGNILDDTYYVFFLTNTLPYLPQTVYQDPDGVSAWSNPIEVLPNGTLPNNLYFPESAVYRIEIRQGPTQSDTLVGNPIENFVIGAGENLENDPIQTAQNIITNPQFADLYIPASYTITKAVGGTYTVNIGPGWQLVLTGTGTSIITQKTNAGVNDIATNPPYYLEFNNSGWDTVQLIQTFNNNGALYGNGALTLSFMGIATASDQNITVSYNPSNVNNAQTIFTGDIVTGGLNSYYAAININESNNTDTGEDAYTQIIFNLLGTGTIAFTNIQILGQSKNFSDNWVFPNVQVQGSVPTFQEEPYERMVDREFHVYKNSIILQPKDSILVGWQFGLNPWQSRSVSSSNVADNFYTCDQTIIIQQQYVASATGNNIAVGQASNSYNQGYQVEAVTDHNQFGVLQYLDPTTTDQYWGYKFSALVQAQLVSSKLPATTVKFKMRLIVNTTVPTTTNQNYPVASWTEGQDPTFDAAFTVIAPENDPVYTLSTDLQSYAFNGFQLPAASSSTMVMGIMLYTITNMDSAATADVIILNDISLCRNDFAIASNLKSFDTILRECQFYYEKSYENDVPPGTASGSSQISIPQNVVYNGSAWECFNSQYGFRFSTVKRANPTMTFYSPTSGTSAKVDGVLYINATSDGSAANLNSTYWTLNTGRKGYSTVPASNTVLMTSSAAADTDHATGAIIFHYTADSRIGA